jgi:hypothetical protein
MHPDAQNMSKGGHDMEPKVMIETAKALKAAGLGDEAIANVLAGNSTMNAETKAETKKPKPPASKRKFSMTADKVEVTDETRKVADECIGYALATGESKAQMKIKAAELFNVSGLLECKDQDEAMLAWEKLLEASVAVPEKVENRNNGKMVSARFTSGPNKGKIKWTVSNSLSALFERGREMIQAFIPMRDKEGWGKAEEKLLVAGGQWATKSVILAVRGQYKTKKAVDGVKQSKINAQALKGVVDKYITTKSDAKKTLAEITPIWKEIEKSLKKLAK